MIATWCLEKFEPTFTAAMSLLPLDIDPKARGQFYSTPMNEDWTA